MHTPMPSRPEVVVVTGASAGLGRATAQAYARRGARIGLIARGKERLDDAKAEVEYLGGQAVVLPGDVADHDFVDKAAAEVEETFGPIDVWVNNAMVTVFGEFESITPEEFKRVTEVTYLGVVNGTHAALKRMLDRDAGVVVQVGSALADRSIPLQSAYCGAKHAIRGFTDSIRSELIHRRSRVHLTMVQMPALNTPQFQWGRSHMPNKAQPVPPIFQPDVGAQAIVWAANHRRRELYVGMSTLEAILGNKLMPGCLDHYLATHAWDGQQRDEPEDPNRPDNLFEPVEGDYGAHGPFDNRSRSGSLEFWAARHRRTIGWGAAALGLGLLLGARMNRRGCCGES